jgi:hypothetical protein
MTSFNDTGYDYLSLLKGRLSQLPLWIIVVHHADRSSFTSGKDQLYDRKLIFNMETSWERGIRIYNMKLTKEGVRN